VANMADAVMILRSTQEILDSNLDWDKRILTGALRGFHQSLQAFAGIVTTGLFQILTISVLTIIQSINAVQS
jgi:hypothetical protein